MSQIIKRKKILIVSKAYYYSLTNVNMNKYLLLKDNYYGDFLGITDKKEFVDKDVDGFKMRVTYLPKNMVNKKFIKYIAFFFVSLVKSLISHYRQGKYDIIIAREPQLAGPIALLISKLTGVKLIVELNGNYASPYVWEDVSKLWLRKIKRRVSLRIIPFVLKRTDGIKLLYPSQADYFLTEQELTKKVVKTFHEYTPVSLFKPTDVYRKIILSMGFPCRIKGFDIAIKGFLKIAREIPDYELHLVGYLKPEEREQLLQMIGDNTQVKLLKPVDYPQAIEKISECSIFLLASRTEGMGRVLLEAMAHRKPLIGSNADGIPSYVRDGVNGLIFTSQDADELSEKMLLLVKDEKMRENFANNGLKYVHDELSEEKYLSYYHNMIQAVTA